MSHIPHLMHIDAKSPAKSPSLAQPRPDPEEGFGRLRVRAHTLSKPDPTRTSLHEVVQIRHDALRSRSFERSLIVDEGKIRGNNKERVAA